MRVSFKKEKWSNLFMDLLGDDQYRREYLLVAHHNLAFN